MFDQDKFSEIITKIKDFYGSVSDFANAASVGRSYLSKYKNKRIPAPPTPKVLERIAEASNGITDYDELMQVCGYLNSNMSSKDIMAQNICKEYENKIDSLYTNIDKDFIFGLLIKQDEHNATVLNTINDYILMYYGTTDSAKELYNIIEEIDRRIKELLNNQGSMGIPLFSISKVNMFKVGYFPFEENTNDYIAVKATTDKMLPLLGIDDIAVIHLQENIVDGQTLLLLIDDSYYDIAKIFSEANICKLYFMNSKFEELELSRIKVIGEVVLCQNKSAFKKRRD
ncbi:MAG: helix-turn-helix transcriptional regulator [Clostridia bacterium]|nr:helix-turn-helix transcriptional regulator [Clostridia bacterium]